MCIIVEIDSKWLLRVLVGKRYFSLALGFIAITIWIEPFSKIVEAIELIGADKHVKKEAEQ